MLANVVVITAIYIEGGTSFKFVYSLISISL
jgi:hypothetical protein